MKTETRNPNSELRTRFVRLTAVTAAVLVLAGCQSTRSISNSAYREPQGGYCYAPRPNGSDPGFAYHGELSEFDVLGIERGMIASEADIQQALAGVKQVRLKPGSSVLLIQSGAMFPDGPMVAALSPHFRVVPFTGVPPVSRRTSDGHFERADADSFSRSLRLAAARGGCDTILCYWGSLEAKSAKLATKTVSWVPVVNWFMPDESEIMRIQLKLALVDVRTGDWAVLSPTPIEASKLSASPRRGVADQKLVERLKQQAYVSGARELLQQYAGMAMAN
jgi:hypothetical protein